MERLRVCIVEDDPFYQRFLKELMERNYHAKVYVFDNGGDLLKNLKLGPHIIFIDHHLSKNPAQFNGLELIDLLNDAQVPVKKVLLTSAENLDFNGLEGFDYLEKSEKSLNDVMQKLEETLLERSLGKEVNRSLFRMMSLGLMAMIAVAGLLAMTVW